MNALFHWLFAPGFFSNAEVQNALWLGTVVAIVAGVAGVFLVMRSQSFAGHAMSDMGAAGAAGALLLGLDAVAGFLSFSILAGVSVDLLGIRPRERDVATGLVLTAVLGLGSLFLFFDTRVVGAPEIILFGSIFATDPSLTPLLTLLSVIVLVAIILLYRPLLFATVSAETARARGIHTRLISLLYMIVLSTAVGEASLVVGSLLSTALIIGPAASAVRLTRRPGVALLFAAGIGTLATWIGIVLAYDSYNWQPIGRGWPVSFFISGIVFLLSLTVRFSRPRRSRKGKNLDLVPPRHRLAEK